MYTPLGEQRPERPGPDGGPGAIPPPDYPYHAYRPYQAPQPRYASAPDARSQRAKKGLIIAGSVVAVLVVLVILLVAAGAIRTNTAQGGCWYVSPTGNNSMAIHLPVCDGAEADFQRNVLIKPGGMIPGSEPSNAQETCQMGFGPGPTGWVGVWADSTSSLGRGAAQELCQMDVNSNGRVRWSNFH